MTIINFGKFKNQNIEDVFDDNLNYFSWVFKNKFQSIKNPELFEFLEKKLKNVDEYYLPFGKYKNKSLNEVKIQNPGYIRWLKAQDLKNPDFKKAIDMINL